MFTGIIHQTGTIASVTPKDQSAFLTITAPGFFADSQAGDSIAVNGTCLTVLKQTDNEATFELGPETIQKTNLMDLQEQDIVNLELPLRLQDRLGGHFVQGHVDATAEVIGMEQKGDTAWMTIKIPESLVPYTIDKGSIALDGVSLTVAKKDQADISIMLMDYTLEKTNLREKKIGDRINVEVDMLAKYVLQAEKSREREQEQG